MYSTNGLKGSIPLMYRNLIIKEARDMPITELEEVVTKYESKFNQQPPKSFWKRLVYCMFTLEDDYGEYQIYKSVLKERTKNDSTQSP